MAVKETKRDILNYVLEKYSNDEKLVAYATHEIELLDKKKSNAKPSRVQVENENLKVAIYETLKVATEPLRVADIQAKNETLKELSNQKMTSLITQLKNEGKIERLTDKKVALFKAVVEE